MIAVNLYTTLGCHLCEQAHEQLNTLITSGADLEVTLVEIADDDDLVDRYGIRIPVVKVNESELGWPFSIDQLAEFLEAATT